MSLLSIFLLISFVVFLLLALVYSVRGWGRDYVVNEYWDDVQQRPISIGCIVLAALSLVLLALNQAGLPVNLARDANQWMAQHDWSYVQAEAGAVSYRTSRVQRFCATSGDDIAQPKEAMQLFDQHPELDRLVYAEDKARVDHCIDCQLDGTSKFTCRFGTLTANPVNVAQSVVAESP